MLDLVKRIFGPAPAAQPAPTQGSSVQGRPLGIGIAYTVDGKPKLDKEFVENLSPVLRVHVNNVLMSRGFRLSDQPPYYTEGT